MAIHVKIDRLVLNGLHVHTGQVPEIRAGIERELKAMAMSRIEAGKLKSTPSRVDGGAITMQAASNSKTLANHIAKVVYKGMTP